MNHSDTAKFLLSKTVLGGGLVSYYKDGGIKTEATSTSEQQYGSTSYWSFYLGTADGSARYDSSNPGDEITEINSSNSYALYAYMTEATKTAAKSSAKLLIYSNYAGRGGGIASNGSVIIGNPTTEFTVNKVWDENTTDIPESITVYLYNSSSSGGYVQEATLSESNNWTYTFENLSYGDDYSYYVKEEAIDGFVATYSSVIGDYEEGYSQTITNTTTKITISKLDENGNNLSGAILKIVDEEGNTIVDEFTTTDESTVITGVLNVGETYILKEVSAPDGYILADDVEFTVGEDGTAIVEMSDEITKTTIYKLDGSTGEAVSGATLQILDSEGHLVYEWVSSDEAEVIYGLTIGETYTLHEAEAPDGYVLADDITFTIDETGITEVTMYDPIVEAQVEDEPEETEEPAASDDTEVTTTEDTDVETKTSDQTVILLYAVLGLMAIAGGYEVIKRRKEN